MILFFQSEFQEDIRLHFQNSGDIEQQFQRKATVHSWSFYRGQMLAADTYRFRKLLLRQFFGFAVISNGIGEIFHALCVVKIVCQNNHPPLWTVYPKYT